MVVSGRDVETIRQRTFVQSIELRESVDSTNRLASEMIGEATLPLLVVANEQTAGRGRGGNSWWSPQGALMFSLVVNRVETKAQLPPYSLYAGLAVRDAIQSRLGDCRTTVKWPNDVYVGDQKICGILIEVPAEYPDVLVIGIGINVNCSLKKAPAEIVRKGTSLLEQTGNKHPLPDVLVDVLANFERELVNVANATNLSQRWSEHCYLTGKSVSIQRGERIDAGTCMGIDESGSIVIGGPTGEISVSSGVVVAIGD